MTTADEKAPVRWKAFESSPELLTKLVHGLGVPDSFAFVELIGLDEELLATIPPDCLALVVLFPDEKVKAASKADGKSSSSDKAPSAFFLEQIDKLQNACGTIAVIHSVANNLATIKLKEGSALAAYLSKAKDLSPRKRGELLESDQAIEKLHSQLSAEGETDELANEDDVQFHFVALVPLNKQVVLLDGLAGSPVAHGAFESSKSDGAADADADAEASNVSPFLKAAVSVVKTQILSKMGGDVNLNCVALVRQTDP